MSLPQPLEHLLENLIALRDNYQHQLTEAEYNANSAQEQISHVNALLVDQLGYHYAQSLIALRSHYQSIAAQHQQSAIDAKIQLAHVNALVADRLVWSLNPRLQQQSVSISAPDTIEPKSEQLQLPTLESDSDEIDHPTPNTSNSDDIDSPTPDTLEPSQSIDSEQAKSLSSVIKTPMLPTFQHLSKIQAVEKLLRENQGSILHVDYIIRALYGEMDALAIKDEKPRMYDTLTQGTKKGLWEKVPDSPSCYTINLKLLQSNDAAKQKNSIQSVKSRRTTPARGKVQQDLLPRYRHLNLTAAIESVVHENAGKILTTTEIAKELYGDLSGRALTQAKDKIGKTLWSGTKQGRWQHVSGKIGCYTLDLKMLK